MNRVEVNLENGRGHTAVLAPARRTAPRFSERMPRTYTILLILALAALAGAAGCLSTSFGEVTYSGDALQVHVENPGEPVENAVLQVTIMEVSALEQHEAFSEARYIDLVTGENEYTIRADLQPGSYKAFLTIFVGSERRASVIRDLEVTA
ncbi:hypothetical protein [Methanoculleus sp. MH98A]|uniref:hypothetical protein n=1 Tax=Methanoculleus sp. MH98A TaxID=1495314 RepID=UPI00064E6C7C|nr:hypothetical protein [Methanoculleus sp. MH98A]